jgi:alpha-galactosidase
VRRISGPSRRPLGLVELLALLALLVLLPAAPAFAQRAAYDSARQRWTLRSGPVLYRLAARDGSVALDYFGPAAKEGDSTRVAPSYPRVPAPELAGPVGGEPLAPASLRLTAHRMGRVAPGVEELRLTLRHATLPLEIEERYAAWGETGVITRELTVTNRGRAAIPVDIAPTWLLPGGGYTLRYLYGEWGQERQLATEPVGAGVRQFEQVKGRSSKGYVPWLSLRNERLGLEYLAELAWSGNWRMQVERTPGENDIALPSRPVAVRMGMRHDGGAPLSVAPGASFAMPRLALTASDGDLDDVANQMHRYQRAYVSPPALGNRPLLVQFNSWYPFGQDVDVERLKAAADAAAAIGAEVYVVDSGWYVDKDWVLELGDWQVSKRKFPRGLEDLADHVRRRGMKFGLWVEIENLGQGSRMFREHPDWCLSYKGEPVINDRRCQLDFAKPAVRQWARATVERLVTTYRLAWIKIDYNIDAGDRFDPARPDRAGARLYDHLTSYYQWLDELRAAHPELVVENCSSGALRFDTGIMAHAHTTWVSDVVNAKPSLQLRYGCTLQFAPELCNHWMVGDKDNGEVDPNAAPGWWDFMFRVPMNGQFGISSRVLEWSPAVRDRAVANVALYKRIRETIAGADVYHLTPAPDHNRPTGWMALQYVAPAGGRSVMLAYRLAGGAATQAFRLRGLKADVRYDISRDGERQPTATGAELASAGLRVALGDEWRAAVIELVPRP